jgi:hypothetical protein
MSDSVTSILQDIAAGNLTPEEGEKKIAGLKGKNGSINIKVGPKGGICIYGLRKMPITLYEEELNKILDYFLDEGWQFKGSIMDFFNQNREKLSTK